MAAAEPLSLEQAWARIPAPASLQNGSERFTAGRMERIMAIVVGVGAIALGIQTFFESLDMIVAGHSAQLTLFLVVLLFLVTMIVACLWGRGAYVFAGTFAVAYAVALALWPLVVIPDGQPAGAQPWIFFLVNIATVAAIVAFPMLAQLLFVLVLPFVYGWVRIVQGDFAEGFWIATAFDVSFTLILGIVLLALAWMFRSVAAGVDDTRAQAVESYSAAAATAAVEQERVAVAALMHDSVLAALIAAERAESERERELAVVMAREALTRLANAEEHVALEGSDEPVAWERVVDKLQRVLAESDPDATVEAVGDLPPIPERVARAAALAAQQACRNAVEHAGGRGLRVRAEADGEAGFTITIRDAGPGFDVEATPEDRLGIRASIVARMAAVAGAASVESDDEGTVVTLRWPIA